MGFVLQDEGVLLFHTSATPVVNNSLFLPLGRHLTDNTENYCSIEELTIRADAALGLVKNTEYVCNTQAKLGPKTSQKAILEIQPR